jgi:hypothetical protein
LDYQLNRVYTDDNNFYLFELTSFLYDIQNSGSVNVNCNDTANLFNIYTAALGLSSMSKVINGPQMFWTNEINTIGNAYGWQQHHWFYHHFGWYDNLVNDPCAMIDKDGEDEGLATNMLESTYKGHLLVNPASCPYSQTGTTTIKDEEE